MDRRTLLKSSGALAALTFMPVRAFADSGRIEVSLDTGPNHVRNLSMEALAKEIGEASSGQLEMKVFHSASKYKGADVPIAVAQRALDITEDNERLIGSVLLGNNLVNILATSLATALFTRLFGESGVALATLVMTLLVLIFAEVLPKTYAISNSVDAAARVARPIGPQLHTPSPPVWLS